MEFTFTTAYNQKAMTAMARALRKFVGNITGLNWQNIS